MLNTDLLNLPKLKKLTLEFNSKLKITTEFRKIAQEKKIEIKETELPKMMNFLD